MCGQATERVPAAQFSNVAASVLYLLCAERAVSARQECTQTGTEPLMQLRMGSAGQKSVHWLVLPLSGPHLAAIYGLSASAAATLIGGFLSPLRLEQRSGVVMSVGRQELARAPGSG